MFYDCIFKRVCNNKLLKKGRYNRMNDQLKELVNLLEETRETLNRLDKKLYDLQNEKSIENVFDILTDDKIQDMYNILCQSSDIVYNAMNK
jgi:hypothetical protein